jgi:hypothetical protein
MVSQRVEFVRVPIILVRDAPTVREPLNPFAFNRGQTADTAVGVADVVAAPVRAGMPGRASVKTMGEFLDYWSFAKISNALLKGGNRFLPMRSARLSIPLAAFELKKYFWGTAPFSITSHNEHSLARLGDSEVFAVKHTPSDSIPVLGQRSNNDFEVSSSVGRQKAWNILDDTNCGATLLKQSRKLIKESRLLPSKPSSRAHSRQRDVLAWESSDPNVTNGDGCSVCDFFDVRFLRYFRPVLLEDRTTEWIDFALVGDSEACSLEAKVEPSNP